MIETKKLRRGENYQIRKNVTSLIDGLLLADKNQRILTSVLFDNKKMILINKTIKDIFLIKNIQVNKETIKIINEKFNLLNVYFLLKPDYSNVLKEKQNDIYKAGYQKNSKCISVSKDAYKLQKKDFFNYQFNRKISFQSFWKIEDYKIM
jgi:uncharacterized protein YfkK (UPF0435 family)